MLNEKLWLQINDGKLRHLNVEDNRKVLSYFRGEIEFLQMKDAISEVYIKWLKEKIKYMYKHNYGLKNQLTFFLDETLNQYVKITLRFKIFCLLTRIL